MTRHDRIGALAANPVFASLRRSLDVYYGDPAHEARMVELYGRFVKPGVLAFDIGSHVGDRIGAFRRLGARVVALEPQPLCMRALEVIHGHDTQVTLVRAACGAQEGMIDLQVNSTNPTVTTASQDFVTAAQGAAGWEGQQWDQTVQARMTTLDALIAEHGVPAFAKIDVEGFEADVLVGLSQPLPALSFEFTTIQRDVAYRCLDRLAALGAYRFNLSLGESHALGDEWVLLEDMAARIAALPHEANSGDVYAVLKQ